MRLMILSATALAVSASVAVAAPAAVSVSIAPELRKTFHENYGDREAGPLATGLQRSVERALARSGSHDDARVELVLTEVKPNRPTFKQLSDKPGLSLQSFGIGGATIEGRIVAADGAVTPVSYRWYETDIRQARQNWVWADAETAFDSFARRLAHGDQLAKR